MPRIRRPETPRPAQTFWRVGKYIRLSREDGNAVSESVVNQGKILDAELPGFFPDGRYEVVDTYIDDGTSATTDLERRDFQRMVRDMEAGRINCVVVKNLSRAFRNSANQGRFLEEFIPLYHTRFISLYQPRIDTFLDPEIVHSLEVSITGFLNEQYAYKTSADVRRTFRCKREKGEFIGAFAPYGYAKDPGDRNRLVIDPEAAGVVRDIFAWFVSEGMSKAGIARRLNGYGIPNPSAYKRARGFRYENPHDAARRGTWSASTVSRILRDPLYTGVMRQGRQRVVSYKVHRRTAVPEEEWFMVEDAVPPVVESGVFRTAQELHRRDTRTPPGEGTVYPFSGLVRCADCGRNMVRHSAKGLVYYQCRTYRTGGGCTRHSIRLDALEEAVQAALRMQIDRAGPLPVLSGGAETPASARLESLLAQRTRELEKAADILDGLYLDWKNGDISREQYQRLRERWEARSRQLREAAERIRAERDSQEAPPRREALWEPGRPLRLSRGLLVELIGEIRVHGDRSIDIEFNFADPDPEGCA